MQDNNLLFDLPRWFAGLALVISLGITVGLYWRKSYPWNQQTTLLLGALRFLGVFLLLLLLMNPLLKQVAKLLEKPIIVLAIDNSQSVKEGFDSVQLVGFQQQIAQLKKDLEKENLQVELELLEGFPDDESISFDGSSTNLSSLLYRITEDYDGRNLASILLVSDGIFNQGLSPTYWSSTVPVYTLGVGDTIPPRDIAVLEVQSNRIAYQGNRFPVKVRIKQTGYDKEECKINLTRSGEIIEQPTVVLDAITEIDFLIEADEPGLIRYTVTIPARSDESTLLNNSYDFYIDVIEGRERILITARSPHPDIKAVRSSLEKNETYETSVYIPGISKKPTGSYDVVVALNAFGPGFQNMEIEGDPSYWYVLGESFNTNQLQDITGVSIKTIRNQKDNVKAAYNALFSSFSLGDEFVETINNFPPLQVPYGEYGFIGPVKTLLYQKIGKVTTERPLLTIFDDGNTKNAVLLASGFWKWRMMEFALDGTTDQFDNMVTKTIQYLSVKSDKRQFRISPEKNVYDEGEEIKYNVEVYNDIYERIYNNTITIFLTDESGDQKTFEYIDNPSDSKLRVGKLEPGIYQWTASTNLNDSKAVQSGELLVKEMQLELINSVADHHVLRLLSERTGGQFFTAENSNEFVRTIDQADYKGSIKSIDSYFPLINKTWILMLVILLFSTEWFIRKYLGSY